MEAQFVPPWIGLFAQFNASWSEGEALAPDSVVHALGGGEPIIVNVPGAYPAPIEGFRWYRITPRANRSILVG